MEQEDARREKIKLNPQWEKARAIQNYYHKPLEILTHKNRRGKMMFLVKIPGTILPPIWREMNEIVVQTEPLEDYISKLKQRKYNELMKRFPGFSKYRKTERTAQQGERQRELNEATKNGKRISAKGRINKN